MPNNNMEIYDASAPALGYLYQIRYALFISLKKMQEVNDTDDCYISIESVDDISFENGDDPLEVIQTKHHTNKGNLSDRSPDIWKTVRIWSELILNEPDQEFFFTLVTTQSFTPGSLISKLGIESESRDVNRALSTMKEISKETSNVTNSKSYNAFNTLDKWQQKKLVHSIYSVGNTPNILEVEKLIKKKIRLSASLNHIDAFTSRLEGLWFKRVINLFNSDDVAIPMAELVSYIDELRHQFLPTNLPDDFGDKEPEEAYYADHESYVFVEQLRLIDAPDSVLKIAILNFYRAFEQRSRWSREGLVKPGEIAKYLNILKEEWTHINSFVEWKNESPRDLYEQCQNNGAKPIRPEFKSSFVARGSYHDLANEMKIGWHPDYLSLLSANDDLEAS